MTLLAALCGAVPVRGDLLLGLFLAGAVGSTMHCVPMCGGFVLGQVADRMASIPASALCQWQRVSQGALLPYHLGRLTTYAGLGAIAGGAGAAFRQSPWFAFVSTGLLLVGAALFLVHALRRLVPAARHLLPALDRAPQPWSRVVASVAARMHGGGYLLGVALGFLPCGLLYAGLATAASGLDPVEGLFAMLAFGLGTAPALIVVGVAGQTAGRRWQRRVAAVSPILMLLNAGLLTAIALQSA